MMPEHQWAGQRFIEIHGIGKEEEGAGPPYVMEV